MSQVTQRSSPPPSKPPRIGERLRAAREARGLSYEAVAAELRIRPVILAAIEREDSAALPERVYLLGLLRTYARHLGIDPTTVAAAWGGEVTETTQATGSTLRTAVGTWTAMRAPVATESALRAILRWIFSRGVVGLAILAVVGLLLVQAIRFASPPLLSVVSPSEEVLTVSAETRVAAIRGTSSAGTVILVSNAIGDRVTTEADVSGVWSIEIPLGGGRNEVEISALDPATGSSSGNVIRRVFIVNLPVSDAPRLVLLNPIAGLRVSGGAVPVALTTEPNGEVVATATSASGEVLRFTFSADSLGTVQGDLVLPAGSWTTQFQATGPNGTTSEVLREVEVVFVGVNVTIKGSGPGTWIRVWVDGAIDSTIGPTGLTLRDGVFRTIRGTSAIDIRFGNPRGASVTLNGRMLEERGVDGVPEGWSFRADGRVLSSSRK